ncbi:hypothetical protein O9993_18035 [Vibrio lentus]|nr:hypothetical protein [Vibrio lentus]
MTTRLKMEERDVGIRPGGLEDEDGGYVEADRNMAGIINVQVRPVVEPGRCRQQDCCFKRRWLWRSDYDSDYG